MKLNPVLLCYLASLLLLGMAVSSLLHLLYPSLPAWVSGLCAWLVLGMLLLAAHPRQFQQFFLLSGVGLAFLLWGWWRGASVSLNDILLQNNGLMVMLYSVGFLRLVATSAQAGNEPLPQGRRAFVNTLLGVHVLGAVINISILILVAERLKSQEALGRQAVTVIGRAFSMAAFWSPFFAAMAVALTYAPGAELHPVILTGLGLTALAMLVTVLEMGGSGLRKVQAFRGYPMHAGSLLIPTLLAVAVMVLHQLLPNVPVLMLVSTTAVTLAVIFLFLRQPETAKAGLKQHVWNSAPRLARELGLFMGAGLLTVGVQAVTQSFSGFQPFAALGGLELSLLLGGAIVVSLLGVHPVVSVAVIGPLVQPLYPDPNVLAMLFLCIWSLGVVASPFSGLNAIMRSQLEVSGRDIMLWNIGYVVVMWVMVSAVFFLIAGSA